MCTAEAYMTETMHDMNKVQTCVVVLCYALMYSAYNIPHAHSRRHIVSVTCDAVMAQVRPPLLHLTLEGEGIGVGAREEIQHRGVVVQNVH